jgi:hypothetical protein
MSQCTPNLSVGFRFWLLTNIFEDCCLCQEHNGKNRSHYGVQVSFEHSLDMAYLNELQGKMEAGIV